MCSLNVHMLTDLKSITSCKTSWSDKKTSQSKISYALDIAIHWRLRRHNSLNTVVYKHRAPEW